MRGHGDRYIPCETKRAESRPSDATRFVMEARCAASPLCGCVRLSDYPRDARCGRGAGPPRRARGASPSDGRAGVRRPARDGSRLAPTSVEMRLQRRFGAFPASEQRISDARHDRGAARSASIRGSAARSAGQASRSQRMRSRRKLCTRRTCAPPPSAPDRVRSRARCGAARSAA